MMITLFLGKPFEKNALSLILFKMLLVLLPHCRHHYNTSACVLQEGADNINSTFSGNEKNEKNNVNFHLHCVKTDRAVNNLLTNEPQNKQNARKQ